MKNKFFFLIFIITLISCQTTVYSQSESIYQQPIIKVSTLTMGHLYTPSIQFSYEKRFTEKWAYQIDLGYINDFNYAVVDENLSGFRSRVELRKYKKSYEGMRFYIGVAGQYKQTFAQNKEWLVRFDQGYTQELSYKRNTTSVGLFFTHGFQVYNDNNNTTLEVGMLYGFRVMKRAYPDLPEDVEFPATSIGFREGLHYFPTLFPILKLGYAL